MHWTQTPEGRKKMQRRMVKFWASMTPAQRSAEMKRRREVQIQNVLKQHQPQQEASSNDTSAEVAIAFAAGWCGAWLESYARSNTISVKLLTDRVGAILQRSARR